MKLLLLAICLFLTLSIFAQIPSQKTLVANETWIVRSTNTTFRLITSNDSVASKVVYLVGITRFTASKKTDRNGYYWERSFYFSNNSWNTVIRFIDKLNKYP